MPFPLSSNWGFVLEEVPQGTTPVAGSPAQITPTGNYTPSGTDTEGAPVSFGTTTLLAEVTLPDGTIVAAGTTVYALLNPPSSPDTITVNVTGKDSEGNALNVPAASVPFAATEPTLNVSLQGFVLPAAPTA
jgi:hypothetical protein